MLFVKARSRSQLHHRKPRTACRENPASMASLPQDPAHPEKKKRPSALRSIIAGSTAGALEIGMRALLALLLAESLLTCA